MSNDTQVLEVVTKVGTSRGELEVVEIFRSIIKFLPELHLVTIRIVVERWRWFERPF